MTGNTECPACHGPLTFFTNGNGQSWEACTCYAGPVRRDPRIPELPAYIPKAKRKRNGHQDRLLALARKGIVPEPKVPNRNLSGLFVPSKGKAQ